MQISARSFTYTSGALGYEEVPFTHTSVNSNLTDNGNGTVTSTVTNTWANGGNSVETSKGDCKAEMVVATNAHTMLALSYGSFNGTWQSLEYMLYYYELYANYKYKVQGTTILNSTVPKYVGDKMVVERLGGIIYYYVIRSGGARVDIFQTAEATPGASMNMGYATYRNNITLTPKFYTAEASKYRYGFQGQEGDDEVAGQGNSLTAQFWQYDSRLGRRWNVDPVVKSHESPYAAFANNPILLIDPSGADTSEIYTNGNPSDKLNLKSSTGNAKQGDMYTVHGDLTIKYNPGNNETSTYYASTITGVYHEGNDYGDAGWYTQEGYEYINRDWANNQVLEALSSFKSIMGGYRDWNGWAVNSDGYLTGGQTPKHGYGPDLSPAKAGRAVTILQKLQAAKHLRKKGVYEIYKGYKETKEGELLLYFGKARNGIKVRYAGRLRRDWQIEGLGLLNQVPNNGIALGVEHAIMELNGWTGKVPIGGARVLSNNINATNNHILRWEGVNWLNKNVPNWKELYKFQ